MQVVKREILQTLFYSCALCHVHVTICFLYMTSVLCRILKTQYSYFVLKDKIYLQSLRNREENSAAISKAKARLSKVDIFQQCTNIVYFC
jgi:hypothetical protein